MAATSAMPTQPKMTLTHTHFKAYLPPSFLHARTSSNLDSQSTRETEPTPTPEPRHKLKDPTLPPTLNHRQGSSTALDLLSGLPLSPQLPLDTPTTSLGSEHGDTEDEDMLSDLRDYDIEGVSREDLKLWMQSAPADQKLEMVHHLSHVLEAHYDTEGISREDLELWHELAPPDQRLEVKSDTESEMDEMDSEPSSMTSNLDLRSLQKAAPPETRRGESHSKRY